uniref:Pheromone binding protein 6 n=1 Tax=Cyrtotrachelus buqueti TaxID=1892066 RepID=A0A1L3KPQ4_9CUCU|nr:pheromone binding protein 6 [Cyrtotrachelus buqueti]
MTAGVKLLTNNRETSIGRKRNLLIPRIEEGQSTRRSISHDSLMQFFDIERSVVIWEPSIGRGSISLLDLFSCGLGSWCCWWCFIRGTLGTSCFHFMANLSYHVWSETALINLHHGIFFNESVFTAAKSRYNVYIYD